MALRTQQQQAAFLLAGSRATAMQRDLVQWNLTQMKDHNVATQGEYLAPMLTLKNAEANWSSLTGNMSVEELNDMEKAR